VRGLAVLAALLTCAGAASAQNADLEAVRAMRMYYGAIAGSGGDDVMREVRDILVANFKDVAGKTKASCIRQLNRGFEQKYDKSNTFLRYIAESLAAGGKNGIATLYRRYKSEGKRDEVRVMIAESLASCGDEDARDTCMKIAYDPEPRVAAAAITGIGALPKADERERKELAKKLATLFAKITDGAAGKDEDTPQRKLYDAVKEPLNGTLGALTGEKLDSAAAWQAWLSENITSKWPE
jgi:hypothetical protein